jgi:glycosyltransferase involved in cell wall biosynthesis
LDNIVINTGILGQETDWMAGRGTSGLVSIIVPTYNRAQLLPDLLECLAVQSWHAKEIIIVDDGSTDHTKDVLTAWAASHADMDVSYIRISNSGPAAARNRGLQHARGEFIYFIDSDDMIFPTTLEDMILALRESGHGYCLARIQTTDINSVPVRFNFGGIPRFDKERIVLSAWMTHSAFYRRSVIKAAGAFNESLRVGEDSEFCWRVVATNDPCKILIKTIGVRRVHEYGHLSVGRTFKETFHHGIDAHLRFCEWALARNLLNKKLGRSITRNIFILSIRLGSQGDWDAVNRCHCVFDSIIQVDKIWPRIAIFLSRPRARGYFIVLLALLNIARVMRPSVIRSPG